MVQFLMVLSCSECQSLFHCDTMQAVCGVLHEQDFVSMGALRCCRLQGVVSHVEGVLGAGLDRRFVAHASISLTAFEPQRSTRGALSSRSMARRQPAHRRHGPRCRGARASSTSMQLTMAAAAEHVRDDIVLASADDEPAAASRVAQDTCATRRGGVAGLELGSVSPHHNQSAARHLHGRPC